MADGALVDPAGPFRDLSDQDLLFRVIKKKECLRRERLSEAFMLGTGETGLSVCYDCLASEAQSIVQLDSHGVAQLLHGGVTALHLAVVPDHPKHAEIRGIPHKETNRVEAERLASELATISTIAHVQRYRKPG